MIKRLKIKQPKPFRYFKSDFLERFTHVRLWHIWVTWGPILILTTLASFYLGGRNDVSIFKVIVIAIPVMAAGFVRWTILEYFLHRFVFHYDGASQILKKLAWFAHGTHHAQAMLNTRLVMPVIASLTIGGFIAMLDWVVFGLILGIGWVGCAFFAGLVLGYLFYDTVHWSVHFFETDWPWYRTLRRNHMRHHRFPQKRFGVSNIFWDRVFGTHPSLEEEKALQKSPVH